MQPPPSSVPPPGYPIPPPPVRKGLPAWAWVLIGCVPAFLIVFVAILAAILFPVFARARDKARTFSCEANEKQISLTLLQYAQDSDGKLPASPAWMDATAPYRAGSEVTLHCPSAWDRDSAKYGYALNSKLRAKNLMKMDDGGLMAMVYDSTNLSRNATDPVTSQPVVGRHMGGNNIAFADGHTEWTRGSSPLGR